MGDARIGLRAEHGCRYISDFDQWRIERHPGYAPIRIRHINPAAHRQPVLAGTRKLIQFRPHHRQRNIEAHLPAGDRKWKRKLQALLGLMLRKLPALVANSGMRIQRRPLFVYGVGQLNPISTCSEAHPSHQASATRRTGFNTDRCDQRALLLDDDLHRAASLYFGEVFSSQKQVFIHCLALTAIDQIVMASVQRQLDDVPGCRINPCANTAILHYSILEGNTCLRRKRFARG